MFTALPENLTSLNTIMEKVSSEIKLYYSSEYGDIDLGTDTKTETYFKIYDTTYRNIRGLLYNYRVKDTDNNVISMRKVVTKDLNFNARNFSFCKSSLTSPSGSLDGLTLIINGSTVSFTSETTFEEVIETIASYDIDNIGAYIDDSYLVVYSTKLSQSENEYAKMSLSGTAITNLGLVSGDFKNASCYFIINGIKYDVKDYEDGVNNYVKYFYVSRR